MADQHQCADKLAELLGPEFRQLLGALMVMEVDSYKLRALNGKLKYFKDELQAADSQIQRAEHCQHWGPRLPCSRCKRTLSLSIWAKTCNGVARDSWSRWCSECAAIEKAASEVAPAAAASTATEQAAEQAPARATRHTRDKASTGGANPSQASTSAAAAPGKAASPADPCWRHICIAPEYLRRTAHVANRLALTLNPRHIAPPLDMAAVVSREGWDGSADRVPLHYLREMEVPVVMPFGMTMPAYIPMRDLRRELHFWSVLDIKKHTVRPASLTTAKDMAAYADMVVKCLIPARGSSTHYVQLNVPFGRRLQQVNQPLLDKGLTLSLAYPGANKEAVRELMGLGPLPVPSAKPQAGQQGSASGAGPSGLQAQPGPAATGAASRAASGSTQAPPPPADQQQVGREQATPSAGEASQAQSSPGNAGKPSHSAQAAAVEGQSAEAAAAGPSSEAVAVAAAQPVAEGPPNSKDAAMEDAVTEAGQSEAGEHETKAGADQAHAGRSARPRRPSARAAAAAETAAAGRRRASHKAAKPGDQVQEADAAATAAPGPSAAADTTAAAAATTSKPAAKRSRAADAGEGGGEGDKKRAKAAGGKGAAAAAAQADEGAAAARTEAEAGAATSSREGSAGPSQSKESRGAGKKKGADRQGGGGPVPVLEPGRGWEDESNGEAEAAVKADPTCGLWWLIYLVVLMRALEPISLDHAALTASTMLIIGLAGMGTPWHIDWTEALNMGFILGKPAAGASTVIALWFAVHPAAVQAFDELLRALAARDARLARWAAGLQSMEGDGRKHMTREEFEMVATALNTQLGWVAAYVVEQHHGRLMRVPPGFMHMVINVQPCIKVAWDWQQPRNMARYLHVAKLQARVFAGQGAAADFMHAELTLLEQLHAHPAISTLKSAMQAEGKL
uniref:JmjC domain-containing protein n=1 Tax=Chlamydomonas leiostraca TaxID=1034604 RepID=A0A7S0WTP6_9CHLO|mmetsp:Transcript_27995/g.71369  ORF Transcript_27995/g.71369 Transcript_27995/m.71369 type:complete len:908 (+) Transcript_27995:1205-3928(+)